MNGQSEQTWSLDVLAQRQINTENAVSNLQNQFSAGFSKLETQLGNLSEKMAASGRPQWQLIASVIGLIVTVVFSGWAFGMRPVEAGMSRMSADIAELTAGITKIADMQAMMPATYLTKQEYETNRSLSRQDLANNFAAVNAEIDQNEQRIRELDAAIVPRGEHEEHWRSQEASVAGARQERMVQIESLQRQVDSVAEQLSGLYSARDVIRDLQSRQDRLDSMIQGMRPQ